MNVSMDSVDEVRKRAKVSYEEAKRALELNDGDVLDAIIYLEQQGSVDQGFVKSAVEKIKEMVGNGFISQIKITKNGQVLFDLPVVAGVAMMALWTGPFAVALVIALAAKCDIKIVKRDGAELQLSNVTGEKLSAFLKKLKADFEVYKQKLMNRHSDDDSVEDKWAIFYEKDEEDAEEDEEKEAERK